jgi:hypothetical protein
VWGLAPASEFAIAMSPYGWRAITFGLELEFVYTHSIGS